MEDMLPNFGAPPPITQMENILSNFDDDPLPTPESLIAYDPKLDLILHDREYFASMTQFENDEERRRYAEMIPWPDNTMKEKWSAEHLASPSFPNDTGKTIADVNLRWHLQLQVPCGGLSFMQARITISRLLR